MNSPRTSSSDDVWPALRDCVAEIRLLGAHFLRHYHLSTGQALTMGWIKEHGGIRLSALADGLGVSRPAATELVSSLESQGWVRRGRLVDDRRGVVVRLTPRAFDLLATFDREFESVVRSATGSLPRDARVPTVRTLSALRNELQERRERSHRPPARPRRAAPERHAPDGARRTPRESRNRAARSTP